jgi:hypothetical protein
MSLAGSRFSSESACHGHCAVAVLVREIGGLSDSELKS